MYLSKFNLSIGLAIRVSTNGPGDRGSIPGRVISKTQKTVLDVYLLNTLYYKLWIKGKAEQTSERVAPFTIPYVLADVVAMEKGAFGSPST